MEEWKVENVGGWNDERTKRVHKESHAAKKICGGGEKISGRKKTGRKGAECVGRSSKKEQREERRKIKDMGRKERNGEDREGGRNVKKS